MSNALIENSWDELEWAEETAFPATDDQLLILTQKLSELEIPIKVFLQAVSIAAYDCVSAFRYADKYLTLFQNQYKRKNFSDFENN
ncbi:MULTISPECIES: hypothetical protein [unclassified Nodularia (in: cyanobacteria)]|uniref:hypothetical protein n=1 Tax=unclassified Nodularia (in: cyanobacteria) TaxID=2656917 RepID=UPI00187F153C|nr:MULTISPECIES: hypothetical protein [unclassified Nodularia (in: cyanobacteria)]MBE9200982.1 hypothetical protein [Nodularia sp. LEGE 06071]MCC2692432.1 hypothetical protein [Nodularia sp. LEGE 04288]